MTDKISISLDRRTQQIIRRVIRERNFGKRGFSLALRQIVNEWEKSQEQPQVAGANTPQQASETTAPVAA